MLYYPGSHSSGEAQFWASRPSREAYMLDGERIIETTVYESPTRPYWYSLQCKCAGIFGEILFDTEAQAIERLMDLLMSQQERIETVLDTLADRYNALLLAEEKEHELSAEYAPVEPW